MTIHKLGIMSLWGSWRIDPAREGRPKRKAVHDTLPRSSNRNTITKKRLGAAYCKHLLPRPHQSPHDGTLLIHMVTLTHAVGCMRMCSSSQGPHDIAYWRTGTRPNESACMRCPRNSPHDVRPTVPKPAPLGLGTRHSVEGEAAHERVLEREVPGVSLDGRRKAVRSASLGWAPERPPSLSLAPKRRGLSSRDKRGQPWASGWGRWEVWVCVCVGVGVRGGG